MRAIACDCAASNRASTGSRTIDAADCTASWRESVWSRSALTRSRSRIAATACQAATAANTARPNPTARTTVRQSVFAFSRFGAVSSRDNQRFSGEPRAAASGCSSSQMLSACFSHG